MRQQVVGKFATRKRKPTIQMSAIEGGKGVKKEGEGKGEGEKNRV